MLTYTEKVHVNKPNNTKSAIYFNVASINRASHKVNRHKTKTSRIVTVTYTVTCCATSYIICTHFPHKSYLYIRYFLMNFH